MHKSHDVVDIGALDPVFIDLETRSCCDLRTAGGHNYALDTSTNLLTVSWSPRADEYHLWFPALSLECVGQTYIDTHLSGLVLHDGPDVPAVLAALVDRPWCAHNSWTFDEPVWKALVGLVPCDWLDTFPLALAAGLPGGLEQIAKRLWGDGKYDGGVDELKKHMIPSDRSLASARNVPVGSQVLIGRYNVQDVRLLRWLWDELCNTLVMPQSEWDVMQASRRCNNRGVKVDRKLLHALIDYTRECQNHALLTIRELTNNRFETQEHLRSRKRVFAWLQEMGVEFGSSLRKEIVEKFVNDHTDDEAHERTGEFDRELPDDTKPVTKNLPLVMQVLVLRMSALRITNAKMAAALQALDNEDVVKALHAYWGAHTGRDAHRRVQVGNLPKPKDGVKPWKILEVFETTGSLPYEKVTATMPLGKPGFRFLSPDDASSAVLRSIFVSGGSDTALGVADLSTIEARVIAWLAGEQWLCHAFKNDVDVYLELAKKLRGPIASWPNPANLPPKKHPFRQQCKIIELGALYQMGAVRLATYGTMNGIDWEELGVSPQEAIWAFRDLHPAIAGNHVNTYEGHRVYMGGFWQNLFFAAIAACKERDVPVSVGKITFEHRKGHLYVLLPSGRSLCYRHARVVQEQFFNRVIDIVEFQSARYGWVRMSPGKWAENVTQAVARDFMFHAVVLMERDNIPVYIRVHDELAGGLRTESVFSRFMKHMTTVPAWAPGFTLDCEGSRMPRYSKSPPPGSTDAVWRNGKFYRQECPKCKAECRGKPVCTCGWSDPYGVAA